MKKFKNQKEMFLWIWENRAAENGYKSELTDNQLFHVNHPKWHWQFLHVLPKGTYPHYKLNPDNIILATPSEHENQEDYDYFKEKQSELRAEYYMKYYGRVFA